MSNSSVINLVLAEAFCVGFDSINNGWERELVILSVMEVQPVRMFKKLNLTPIRLVNGKNLFFHTVVHDRKFVGDTLYQQNVDECFLGKPDLTVVSNVGLMVGSQVAPITAYCQSPLGLPNFGNQGSVAK